MEDFNYLHSNCFEITMVLSCCNYLMAKELTQVWQNNQESLLLFLEATSMGVKDWLRMKLVLQCRALIIASPPLSKGSIGISSPLAPTPCRSLPWTL